MIYATDISQPVTIGNNLVIKDNEYTYTGAPLYNQGGLIYTAGDLQIGDNAEIKGGRAISGGALYSGNGSITIGKNATIEDNGTSWGGAFGAIYASKDVIIGEGSTINNNKYTYDYTSAPNIYGGAIRANRDVTINSSQANPTIFSNNGFTADINGTSGGAIYASNGNVIVGNYAQFNNNMANNGSAIYANNADIGNNVQFVGNKAKSGSTLFASYKLKIGDNVLFQNNTGESGYAAISGGNSGGIIGKNAEFDSNKGVGIIDGYAVSYINDNLYMHGNIITGNQPRGNVLLQGTYIGKNARIQNNYSKAFASAIFQNGGSWGTVDSGSVISGNILRDSTNTLTGAVVNQGGMLTLVDTTIRDNISTGATGGLFNAGMTTIIAQDGNSTISGNIVGAEVTENADGTLSYVSGTGTKHSITNNTPNLYLNAASGKKVIIDDAVTGTGGIYINHAGTYQTASLNAEGNIVYTSHDLPTAGTVEFNSDVTQSGLVLDAGTLHVTKDNALHIGNVTVNSGILDLTTNDTENQSLGSLTLGGAMGLKIDASLGATLADTISANTGSALGNTINLNTVNLTSGMTDQYKKIYISNSVLKDAITGSGTSVYDAVSYGWQVQNDSNGAYILVKYTDFHNFITSVRYDDDTFYNLTDDIDVAQQLPIWAILLMQKIE